MLLEPRTAEKERYILGIVACPQCGWDDLYTYNIRDRYFLCECNDCGIFGKGPTLANAIKATKDAIGEGLDWREQPYTFRLTRLQDGTGNRSSSKLPLDAPTCVRYRVEQARSLGILRTHGGVLPRVYAETVSVKQHHHKLVPTRQVFNDHAHLLLCEYAREDAVLGRWPKAEGAQILIKDLPIKKNQCFQRNFFGIDRDAALSCQPGQEIPKVTVSYISRMALAVKQNEALKPKK